MGIKIDSERGIRDELVNHSAKERCDTINSIQLRNRMKENTNKKRRENNRHTSRELKCNLFLWAKSDYFETRRQSLYCNACEREIFERDQL